MPNSLLLLKSLKTLGVGVVVQRHDMSRSHVGQHPNRISGVGVSFLSNANHCRSHRKRNRFQLCKHAGSLELRDVRDFCPHQRDALFHLRPPPHVSSTFRGANRKTSTSLHVGANYFVNAFDASKVATAGVAGAVLLLSSLSGILFETLTSRSGHVVTLLSAALLSNVSRMLCQIRSYADPGVEGWMATMSSIFASIPRVPTDHFLYDWCWSLLLPASLVFALLSSSSTDSRAPEDSPHDTEVSPMITTNTISLNKSTEADITRDSVLGMALPFFAGSIGSVLGCICSYFCLCSPLSVSSTSAVNPLRSKPALAVLAGCLCASYVGGTVNFFAAAKLATPLLGAKAGKDGVNMGSMLSSMAAADLVVMAFYFAMLSAASESEWWRQFFPKDRSGSICRDQAETIPDRRMENQHFTAIDANESIFENSQDSRENFEEANNNNMYHRIRMGRSDNNKTSNVASLDYSAVESTCSKRTSLTAATLAAFIAFTSVSIASRCELVVNTSLPPPFNPPGTMCAFLALLGLLTERGIKALLSALKPTTKSRSTNVLSASVEIPRPPPWQTQVSKTMSTFLYHSVEQINNISPALSNICFYFLFAAVGATADIFSAVSGGIAALAFASLALAVHAVILLLGTWIGAQMGNWLSAWLRLERSRRFEWLSPTWEEVLTASNAAIGGPATAAAFAAGLVPNEKLISDGSSHQNRWKRQLRNQYRRALVIGATAWGVFGYAIGTAVGVLLTRFLMQRIN